MEALGRSLVIFGVLLVLVGGLMLAAGRIPFLGRLPGDILFQRGGFSFYFPVVTLILVRLLLTVAVNIVIRLLER